MVLFDRVDHDLGRLEVALRILLDGHLMKPSELHRLAYKSEVDVLDVDGFVDFGQTQVMWLQGPKIEALGIGPRQLDEPDGELCLKVYVAEKAPERLLADDEMVPREVDIPGLGSVPTDVVEIGPLALEGLVDRMRPTPGGFSGGHWKYRGGTLGCRVHDNPTGDHLVLSNSHVLAESGMGNEGDLIVQPGAYDGGTSDADTIAHLRRWVEFDFSGRHVNRVDAAVAAPVDNMMASEIAIIDSDPQGTSSHLDRGMRVQKVGRTTRHTWGQIIDTHFAPSFDYPTPSGKRTASFIDQVLCTRYTDSGDSGSLVLNEDREAIGLHYGGSPKSSVFSPIAFVEDYLQIEIPS